MMSIVMTYLTDNSRETSRAAAADGRGLYYGSSLILIEAKSQERKNGRGVAVTD
jgi:hypothetical protein